MRVPIDNKTNAISNAEVWNWPGRDAPSTVDNECRCKRCSIGGGTIPHFINYLAVHRRAKCYEWLAALRKPAKPKTFRAKLRADSFKGYLKKLLETVQNVTDSHQPLLAMHQNSHTSDICASATSKSSLGALETMVEMAIGTVTGNNYQELKDARSARVAERVSCLSQNRVRHAERTVHTEASPLLESTRFTKYERARSRRSKRAARQRQFYTIDDGGLHSVQREQRSLAAKKSLRSLYGQYPHTERLRLPNVRQLSQKLSTSIRACRIFIVQNIWDKVRTCHILILLGFLTIVGSLVPAVWRSIALNDVSGAFSLAQYILGIGVFVVVCIVTIHSRTCTCWQ